MRNRLCARLVLVCLAALALPTSALGAAAPMVDARNVQFKPSAEHNAVTASGVAVVDGYWMQIYAAGADMPLQAVNLGKPDADGNGIVRVDFVSLLVAPLAPGVPYEAIVQAVGPGGTSNSSRSNTFSFSPPPCDPWISPISMVFTSDGGNAAMTVNAAAGCGWTVVSNDPWLTITSAAAGSGTRTVTFAVAGNTARNTRNGTMTIAGSQFRARQDGVKAPKHDPHNP